MARPGRARRKSSYAERKASYRGNWSARLRRDNLLRRYGITPDVYDLLLTKQKGLCAICGYAPSSAEKHLVVDHCHGSLEIRGLLCQWCNRGLGHMKDSPTLLRKAANYLTKALRSSNIINRLAKKAKGKMT